MSQVLEIWEGHTQKSLQRMVNDNELPEFSNEELEDAVVHIAAWVGTWMNMDDAFASGKAILAVFRQELQSRLKQQTAAT